MVKAKIHPPLDGEIKTVTVSMTPSGKYYASVLLEREGNISNTSSEGKVIGRNKARRLAAKVYERISNVRIDFLHKLSRKIVNNNQVVVVENLNVKGMVRNHKLAKAISDCSWEKFVNFLDYKLSQEGKLLVEIDRFFPSSKTCSNCHYKIDKLSLDVRSWVCPSCQTHHDRDENAAINIRAEGIRILQTSLGTSDAANGGNGRRGFKQSRDRSQTLFIIIN